MTHLVETLLDVLRTIERVWPELGKTTEWFRGYKEGVEVSIQTIKTQYRKRAMSLRIDADLQRKQLVAAPQKFEVLGNLKDEDSRTARGLVGIGDLKVGDIVQLYQHGSLFVDEAGCFTWLVIQLPVSGTVQLSRLHFDVLKKRGGCRQWKNKSVSVSKS